MIIYNHRLNVPAFGLVASLEGVPVLVVDSAEEIKLFAYYLTFITFDVATGRSTWK